MWVEHWPGRKHVNVDALSRDIGHTCTPLDKNVRLQELSCGGCRYCTHAHVKWQDFLEEVDDVVPMIQLFQEDSSDKAVVFTEEFKAVSNRAAAPSAEGDMTGLKIGVGKLLQDGWEDMDDSNLPN